MCLVAERAIRDQKPVPGCERNYCVFVCGVLSLVSAIADARLTLFSHCVVNASVRMNQDLRVSSR